MENFESIKVLINLGTLGSYIVITAWNLDSITFGTPGHWNLENVMETEARQLQFDQFGKELETSCHSTAL